MTSRKRNMIIRVLCWTAHIATLIAFSVVLGIVNGLVESSVVYILTLVAFVVMLLLECTTIIQWMIKKLDNKYPVFKI